MIRLFNGRRTLLIPKFPDGQPRIDVKHLTNSSMRRMKAFLSEISIECNPRLLALYGRPCIRIVQQVMETGTRVE